MSDIDDFESYRLRRDGKTYLTKVFQFPGQQAERLRNVRMVIEGCDEQQVVEIDGALCLRLTGNKRKTQVTALVSQDTKGVKRLSLQHFQSRSDGFQGFEKNEFTFRPCELDRLMQFLHQIEFIDLSNDANFHIEDISTKAGPKAVIDASDRGLVDLIKRLSGNERADLLRSLQHDLSPDEINILLGRKQGLAEFEAHLQSEDWSEAEWQAFFDREQWVFGYGLDYRFMTQFDREASVGSGGGTDNQNRPFIDFLMTFTDYTVLVEIKKPDTPIFKARKGGRAGTWDFSGDFVSAVSQIVEQKAEWAIHSQRPDLYSKGGQQLAARTRNAKAILVIGCLSEFDDPFDKRTNDLKRDTFELFRRENRTIDIITYDELLERARFIARSQTK